MRGVADARHDPKKCGPHEVFAVKGGRKFVILTKSIILAVKIITLGAVLPVRICYCRYGWQISTWDGNTIVNRDRSRWRNRKNIDKIWVLYVSKELFFLYTAFGFHKSGNVLMKFSNKKVLILINW